MRWLLLIALVVGCEEHGKSPCGDARCLEAGQSGEAGFIDASGPACAPSGTCTDGPSCGGQCCGMGEQCVAGACMCGTQMACANGDSCRRGGPVGGAVCGSICCGAINPCPLAGVSSGQ